MPWETDVESVLFLGGLAFVCVLVVIGSMAEQLHSCDEAVDQLSRALADEPAPGIGDPLDTLDVRRS